MSKILHKEPVGTMRSVVLTSIGNVLLVDNGDDDSGDRYYTEGQLLMSSSAGCRALAEALSNMADEIDKRKRGMQDVD